MKIARLIAFGIVGVALISGCASPYMLVEATYQQNTDRGETSANITRGQGFDEIAPQISTLAIQAPDKCINESQAKATGRSSGKASDDILGTECGVEMASIERALAKTGYNVISWKVLKGAMKPNTEQPKTNLEAAAMLGADALFQINSLERGEANAGRDARWDRRYYESDEEGSKGEKVRVKKKTADQLDRLSQNKEKQKASKAIIVYNATINASVSYTKNGHAIWFYSWVHKSKAGGDELLVVQTTVECENGACRKYTPKIEENDEEELIGGSSEAISAGINAADRRRKNQDRLMKEVIGDMVTSFSGKS
jgi:hypothetical protein